MCINSEVNETWIILFYFFSNISFQEHDWVVGFSVNYLAILIHVYNLIKHFQYINYGTFYKVSGRLYIIGYLTIAAIDHRLNEVQLLRTKLWSESNEKMGFRIFYILHLTVSSSSRINISFFIFFKAKRCSIA